MASTPEGENSPAPIEERFIPGTRLLTFGVIHSESFESALDLRKEIFIDGQNVSWEEERDAHDFLADHGLLQYEGENVGVVRTRPIGDIDDGIVKVERVGILEEYRGREGMSFGSQLMQYVESALRNDGYQEIQLNAQLKVVSWYERLGYKAVEGEDDFEEAKIMHRKMRKSLKPDQ